MKKLFTLSLMVTMMLLCSVSAKAQYVVINGKNVLIRSTPNVSADNKLGLQNKGDRFKYIGDYGSFYCINYNGQYGYVHKSYAIYEKPAKQKTETKQQFVHIQGNNVRIRTAPSLESAVVGSANRGESYVCLGYTDGWYKIKYGGKVCYVSSQFASM